MFETTTGHDVFARIHQHHLPGLALIVVDLHLIGPHVKGDIRYVQKVIGEIFLDDISLVSQANDEIVDTVRRIDFKDMPQNGLSTDLNHGFWSEMRFFTDTSA